MTGHHMAHPWKASHPVAGNVMPTWQVARFPFGLISASLAVGLSFWQAGGYVVVCESPTYRYILPPTKHFPPDHFPHLPSHTSHPTQPTTQPCPNYFSPNHPIRTETQNTSVEVPRGGDSFYLNYLTPTDRGSIHSKSTQLDPWPTGAYFTSRLPQVPPSDR
jgi:hypothetical protein